MQVLGVIPARWGSTRFPGKCMADLHGKPVVAWVAEAALKASLLDEVIVAADDQRILDAAEAVGARGVMTRVDHPSGTDRVAEAANAGDADIVINIQGDEPLIDPALIDLLSREMLEGSWEMATAAAPIASLDDLMSPNVVKVVCAADGGALYFSRSVIPCCRDAEPDLATGLYWRHIGIYAYRGAFLRRLVGQSPSALEQTEKLEQLRALHLGGRISVLRVDEVGIGVDTPEDLERVSRLMNEKGDCQ